MCMLLTQYGHVVHGCITTCNVIACVHSMCMLQPCAIGLVLNILLHLAIYHVWEPIGKPCSCMQFIKSHNFYYKSRENPYQVLQVTRGSVSVLQVTHTASNVQWNQRFIIITIVPSYTEKNITRLLPLALLLMLHTRNNTDGNKLVIFSGIALYYGDTYILTRLKKH